MSKLLFAVGALALLAWAQPATPIGKEILGPVLAYEASLERERAPTCVFGATAGVAFDRDRETLLMLRENRETNPQHVGAMRDALEAAENPSFDWRLPVPGYRRIEAAPRPSDAEMRQLNLRARDIIQSGTRREPMIELEAASVQSPLRMNRPGRKCASLSLTAPAVSGDIAFVETSYVCGGLCGNGWLYALRREGGGWRIVAVAFTWIS